jgi:hypothetical protein
VVGEERGEEEARARAVEEYSEGMAPSMVMGRWQVFGTQ